MLFHRSQAFHPSLSPSMRNRIITAGMTLSVLSSIVPLASAAEAVTMNQPNNGFYEGPDPEWATLHSTSTLGTPEHREYHREAIRAHSLWHDQNRSTQGTNSYVDAHRIMHQERNMLHRQFHTAPVTPIDAAPPQVSNPSPVVSSPDAPVTRDQTYTNKPSRRSIIADAEEQNVVRLAQR